MTQTTNLITLPRFTVTIPTGKVATITALIILSLHQYTFLALVLPSLILRIYWLGLVDRHLKKKQKIKLIKEAHIVSESKAKKIANLKQYQNGIFEITDPEPYTYD